MCLIITKKEAVEKIAKKDITCYKEVEHKNKNSCNYCSPIQGFPYQPGKLYETEFKFSDEGLFSDKFAAIEYLNEKNIDLIVIQSGFHSYNSIGRAINSNAFVSIFKCTIPKGAKYYKDRSGLICSNKIIINEECGV